jgi:thiosulfate dehydrogenase (quinone) large subunit
MMFLFAYLAKFNTPPGWPVQLMYLTEAAFVIVAFVCVLLAADLKWIETPLRRDMIAGLGCVCASFGLIMPFELAPFFFGARGEIMMATLLLNFAYPVGAILFYFRFRRLMNDMRENIDW